MRNYSQSLFSKGTDNWSTPESVYEELNKEFHFTLDPCSDEENHKTVLYFTKEQDGLKSSWGGRQCSAIRHIQTSASG